VTCAFGARTTRRNAISVWSVATLALSACVSLSLRDHACSGGEGMSTTNCHLHSKDKQATVGNKVPHPPLFPPQVMAQPRPTLRKYIHCPKSGHVSASRLSATVPGPLDVSSRFPCSCQIWSTRAGIQPYSGPPRLLLLGRRRRRGHQKICPIGWRGGRGIRTASLCLDSKTDADICRLLDVRKRGRRWCRDMYPSPWEFDRDLIRISAVHCSHWLM
jgi:hypothetical protein